MSVLTEGLSFLSIAPISMLLMVLGVWLGIFFGCIPGLTATLGVILMIPITYSMEPVQGLSLLIGIYVGGISGGLITAALLNIPGTPSSIFTCWDAYPMSKKGRPGLALSIAVFASLFGGIFSSISLMAIAPQLAKVSLMFGSWELFSLTLMAMCIVAILTEGDSLRSTIGLILGLILGAVGLDSLTGLERLTFGNWQLTGGFSATAIMMGLFAVNEIMRQVMLMRKLPEPIKTSGISFKPPFKELKGTWRTMGLGSVIGTFIGIFPAIGQQTAALMTYNYAKHTSKHPERFGEGEPEGIVASESANNAVCGGALIPLITFGIPGDMTTAALIGGLMIHGLQPGPLLFTENPGIVGAIMLIYLFSNIVMYFMELGLMKGFIKMINIPKSFLFPFIIACCILGVYALNNRVFDVWILFIFGACGFLFSIFKVPMTPIIMGYLMGKTFEINLRRAVISSNGQIAEVFSRPIAVGFLSVSALFILLAIGMLIFRKLKKRKAASAASTN